MSDLTLTPAQAVQVTAPLVVLQTLTEDQVDRLETLISGYKPVRVTLVLDGLMEGAVLFTIFESRNGLIEPTIHGLIEPDGSAHT